MADHRWVTDRVDHHLRHVVALAREHVHTDPDHAAGPNFRADELVRDRLEAVLHEKPEEKIDVGVVMRAVEAARQTGCAVEVAGVRIEPCDTHGRPLVLEVPEVDRG